jgi:TRAP-type C4-dicarboxylate transport system permease small subunit
VEGVRECDRARIATLKYDREELGNFSNIPGLLLKSKGRSGTKVKTRKGVFRRSRMRNPILQAIDIATKITRWLAILAAVGMAVLMIVNFTDVIGTKFFLRSVPGALDISEELMVFLTLLPIAFIALERGHIRIILLEGRMTPVVRFVLQIIQYVIAVLITGFITWRVFVQFQKTVKFMQLKEGLDLPVWPANLATVIAFGFLTLVWMLLLAKTLAVGVER